jgi:hypothetical protein
MRVDGPPRHGDRNNAPAPIPCSGTRAKTARWAYSVTGRDCLWVQANEGGLVGLVRTLAAMAADRIHPTSADRVAMMITYTSRLAENTTSGSGSIDHCRGTRSATAGRANVTSAQGPARQHAEARTSADRGGMMGSGADPLAKRLGPLLMLSQLSLISTT